MIGLLLTSTNEAVQNVIPLKGINAGSGAVGNCSAARSERRPVYQDVGEAVCQASRTPIVGSAIPSGSERSSFAWSTGTPWTSLTLNTAMEGGSALAREAGASLTYAGRAATAVDALCRWGTV